MIAAGCGRNLASPNARTSRKRTLPVIRHRIFTAFAALALASVAGSAHAVNFNIHDYKAGHGPNSATIGDFNNDGTIDIAVANACGDKLCDDNGTVKILLGNDDGTFTEGKKYQSALDGNSVALATADFNNDGNLDVAVVNTGINVNGDVSVILGNGKGGFGPPAAFSPGGVPLFVATGDFNHDGKMDMAVTLNNPGEVSVLLGNGNGTFQPEIAYPVESGPQGLAVADVNGDGNPDLLVVNECGHVDGCRQGTVSVLLGNRDGTFQPQASYFVGIFPLSVAVADMNRDAKPDLVLDLPCGTDASCVTNGGVAVLLGNGDGTFQNVQSFMGSSSDSVRVGAGDFNGDGNIDAATLDYRNGTIQIYKGKRDGTLRAGPIFTLGQNPNSISVGDFNGDGKPDIAVLDQAPRTVSVLLNTSNK